MLRRGVAAVLAAGAAAAWLPAAAGAHIQVTPALVAPSDPVKFTVLVPGERSAETTRVELKMPSELLPFSYEETPGWKRQLIKASNGAVDRVVWTGRSASDGFVEFSFLAGTPEKPGELVFKALQSYSDRTIVRWIGAPGSDLPAAVTRVEAGAPRQNAGGEGAGGKPAASMGGSARPAAAPTPVAANGSGGDGRDPLALALGGAGLVLGLVALTVAGRTGRVPRTPA
jgi:uncharacterized protein YcnI